MGRPWQSTPVEGSISYRLVEIDCNIAWRLILAACLCLCALTAFCYEASAGLMGSSVPLSDQELTIRTHTFKTMKGSRIPCNHGALETELHIFCCTGHFDCGGPDSKSIPCSQVNDDYCDCQNGMDEPGTSACSQQGAHFACASTRQVISTSFVVDGFRDCADGSDELSFTES
ncbi:hypothetical protein CVIRNUC_006587 [Coccomyxa viridis]|uniref:Glucosidase II beta subunit N-terminal domain-containing protein n=1 Tax=Coccomyxa viridis TaxID=1274662 RepID=A0AAV1IC19_9CHLO|nr:hypothetical protein CVIRNUC_006587 [Coccomyxa viridis]